MVRRAELTAFLALVALLAMGAMMVTADPVDVANPPTEDWVFDNGWTTTISGTDWDVGYNITVTNGSKLNIDSSTWTMDQTLGLAPVWITVDVDSTLSIDSTQMSSPDGSTGFYIQVMGELSVTNTDLSGMVANPANHGAISAYGATLDLHTVTISDCWETSAVYTLNTNVSVWWTQVMDVDGNALRFIMEDLAVAEDDVISIFNSEFKRIGGNGIRLSTRSCDNYGIMYMDDLSMDNITGTGLWVEQGDGTSSDHGTGTLNVTIDGLTMRDLGEHGIFTTSYYQEAGPSGMGHFDVTMTDCIIERSYGAGIYNLVYESDVMNQLNVMNTWIQDVSDETAEETYQGIVLEHTNTASAGMVNVSVASSAIQGCIWGGLLDKGNNHMVEVINTTFRENMVYGAYSNCPRNGVYTPMSFTGCDFIDNEGYGLEMVNEATPAGGGHPIDVMDCTFTGNSGPAMAVLSPLSVNQNKAIHVGFNVTACTVLDTGDNPAILCDIYRLVGDAELWLRDSYLNDTGGIQVIGGLGIRVFVRVAVFNTTITNTSGPVIDIAAQANTQTRLNVTLDGLNAHALAGNGVSVSNDMAREQTTTVESQVFISDSVIVSDKGTGLWVSTNGKHQSGPTTISMSNTSVEGMNRALVLRGHDGPIVGCTFHGKLLEDILVVDSVISLRHVDLSGPLEDKVTVMTRGEITLYSTLQVYITWGSGTPAVGATVMVRDSSLTTLAIRSAQNPDGHIPLMTINTYIVQASGVVTRNPYTINATFAGVSTEQGIVLEEDTEVTLVLHDNVPPDVHILSPESGTVQQSSVLRVVGTAWDYQSELASVRYSVDGENWTTLVSATSWNVKINVTNETIDSFDGNIVVQAVAIDSAGNEAMDFITVRIIQRPPGVTVYFPPDGYVTNTAEVKVTGVTDQGALVWINGQPVDLVVTLFEVTMTLVEGENTISVLSMDVLGNTAVVRVKVVLDTRPPYLVLSNPRQNMVTNLNTLTVTAVLENDLDVTVNGETVGYGTDWYPTDSGELEYPVVLEEDVNFVIVEATDLAGNTLRISRQVLFDSEPPWITVSSPVQGELVASNYIEVTGTVDLGAELRLDGEVVTTSHGTFSVSMGATEGENTIVLWAVDGAGNENTLEIDFTVDTGMPHLALTAPASDPQLVSTRRFTITGTVWDGETITASSVYLDGHPYTMLDADTGGHTRVDLVISEEDGSLEIPVDLADGMNEFTVTVMDMAGNTASKRVRLVLDTTPPLLTAVVEPSRTTEDGEVVSWSTNLHIFGSTDPGATLTLNGVPVAVNDDGTYQAYHKSTPGESATLTLVSVDQAGNERTWTNVVTYKLTEEETEEGMPVALIGGLVVLIVLILVAIMYVRSRWTGADEEAIEPEEETMEPAEEQDEWVEEGTEDLDELLEEIEEKEGGES